MNVYDFDGTIRDSDSTVDFYRYCLRRWPRILRAAGRQIPGGLGYAFHRLDKTQAKERFFSFLGYLPDVDAAVRDFWVQDRRGLKAWYQAQRRPDDVIVSAGPDFLLRPRCEELGVGALIASQVDPHTGVFTGLNCRGQEKARRFAELYPGVVPERFFSDNLPDAPIARLAREAFVVKGEQVTPWPWE